MNNKHLIKLIKKYAEDGDLEDPTNIDKPRPAAPAGGYSSPAIQDMQKQLMALAKLVVSQINIADLKLSGPIDKAHPEGSYGPEAIHAAHRNSFGDFIAKRLRKAKLPAVEFDPSKNKTDMKDKQPSIATRMGVIMDTMNRVGGANAEFTPDGKWGPRTNAALHNVYAFAAAMLKLSTDFDTPVESYNETYLGDLESRIPPTDTDWTFEQKKTQAPLISKHIMAIIRMFNEIKEGVLELPDYQSYIEGEPYATFEKGKNGPDNKKPAPAPLTPEAIASMQKTFKDGFEVYDDQSRKSAVITVNDLMNPEAVKAWKFKNKMQCSISKIVEIVRDRVNGFANREAPREYTPQQDQARADRDWKQEQAKAKAIRDGKAT